MISREMVPHDGVPIEFRYKTDSFEYAVLPTYHHPHRLPLTLLHLLTTELTAEQPSATTKRR